VHWLIARNFRAMTKQAVLYSRISIATEESVSVDRQLAQGRRYAEARGWEVVGEFVDEGVSATQNKPESRAAWQQLLASPAWFDAVVIWKVDRLARRVIDFLRADEALQTRGAAIVCVDQSIDLTTGEGRAFAQMLAVFGELEAAAISSRVRAARAHLIQGGRVAGGTKPYGWYSTANPDGPGWVLAQDPERIDWVRAMAARALGGDTIHSIARWLEAENAPLPRRARRRATGRWEYTTLHRLLTNPILAGMTLYNPSRGAPSTTIRDVLRDSRGRPLIREDLAIISVVERKELLKLLEQRGRRAAISRALNTLTSPILNDLAWCGACNRDAPMRPSSHRSRGSLKCPRCCQVISLAQLVSYLERRLIAERGSVPMFTKANARPADPLDLTKLERVEQELQSAAQALIRDDADTEELSRAITALKKVKTRIQRRAGVQADSGLEQLDLTVEDIWRRCETDEQRRELLAGQMQRLTIYRGNRGGSNLDLTRIELEWREDTRQLAPQGVAANPVHELFRERVEWVSICEAARMVECSEHDIRRAVAKGQIKQRKIHRVHPSISRRSVIEFMRKKH
jgi:site-specific DNA recombinase